MRARIAQVMRKNFFPIAGDSEVKSVVLQIAPELTGALPVIDRDGRLLGIIEAHDLLKGNDKPLKVAEIVRQDYVTAHPGDSVDEITKLMLARNVENVVVVEEGPASKPLGVARAADILRLRRWIIEEESHESPTPPSISKRSASPQATQKAEVL